MQDGPIRIQACCPIVVRLSPDFGQFKDGEMDGRPYERRSNDIRREGYHQPPLGRPQVRTLEHSQASFCAARYANPLIIPSL